MTTWQDDVHEKGGLKCGVSKAGDVIVVTFPILESQMGTLISFGINGNIDSHQQGISFFLAGYLRLAMLIVNPLGPHISLPLQISHRKSTSINQNPTSYPIVFLRSHRFQHIKPYSNNGPIITPCFLRKNPTISGWWFQTCLFSIS